MLFEAVGCAWRSAALVPLPVFRFSARTTSATGAYGTWPALPRPRIGEHVGQRDFAVPANTDMHVLLDEAEVDYEAMIADGL